MKLATYSHKGQDQLGLVVQSGLISLTQHLAHPPQNMIALIQRWADYSGAVADLRNRTADVALSDVHLRAPVPRPGKILAIGLNYLDHIQETNSTAPEIQTWFSKMPTSVNGPYDPVEIPAVSSKVDYEAELVFVVGKRARNVSRERAKEVIFGYCVGNDVSVRDWQTRVTQWVLGKSFETHAPYGPWITTADETDARDLDIRCLVNGEIRQSSNTKYLLFDAYAQVEHLSQVMTLEPGDVVFTGTTSGVGAARNPPVFLKEGDVVRVEIEKLGFIENRMARGSTETIIG